MAALKTQANTLVGWLKTVALPLWWEAGGDRERGGFHEALDGEGRPVGAPRRARVQARQTYVYAAAGALGWNGPWREASAHGLEFLMARYRRPDGLFRTKVEPGGEVADDAAWLYDQAFVLFALAAAESAGLGGDHRGAARALAGALDAWRLPEGGFREPPAAIDRQSNPHMHLFESALAWEAIDPDPLWPALADEIAALALARFIDAIGALHEFFAEGWRPAPGVDGRIVEPGHQFEWAWLLERWAIRRGREDGRRAARRLYEIGKGGIDGGRGVAHQQLLDDGAVHDPVGRLWPQTEWLKAALIMGEPDEAVRAIAGLKLYLDRPGPGLWRDKLRVDGSFVDEPSPASSFYHIMLAVSELQAAVG